MGRLGDGENRPAVGGAPGDTGDYEVRHILQTPPTAPWKAGDAEELTLRDKPTSGRGLFPASLMGIAALVAVGFGFHTVGIVGDRRMQKNLDEVAAERAEAEREADLAEARRREAVVEKFLTQRVENATTDEERSRAEQALADWRKDHPGLASNALQAEAGK